MFNNPRRKEELKTNYTTDEKCYNCSIVPVSPLSSKSTTQMSGGKLGVGIVCLPEMPMAMMTKSKVLRAIVVLLLLQHQLVFNSCSLSLTHTHVFSLSLSDA